MTEGIGLAVAAEVPIVVVDVMRGGPSTGIPAKTEQSDLSFAVSGLHGDAPRLVLAPSSISDCVATTQWAVELAETLQAPAIVLSDQFMGQSRAVVVGRDSRVSGPMFHRIVVGTLQLVGADVIDIGLTTTPGCQLAVEHHHAAAPQTRPDFRRGEIGIRSSSTADLKSLHHPLRTRVRDFKSISGTRINSC